MLKTPIYRFQQIRGISYLSQFALLTGLSRLIPFGTPIGLIPDPPTAKQLQKESRELFQADAQNISDGIYPMGVLKPEGFKEHLLRVPRIILDGIAVHFRRRQKKVHDFSNKAKKYSKGLPEYFARNFHFQSDGYLSEKSAELYDHQVEMLFGGTANAMRRILLRPLKQSLRSSSGEGLRILEIGAGTGTMTRFLRLTFPKAKIVATDLSYPYLKVAQKRLTDLDDIDFLQADGAKLPFQNEEFDVVVSVFLFHELPLDVRKAVLKEASRILKPNGHLGLVDSIQQGEVPEYDSLLKDFPVFFHEPFYKNYSINPLEDLVQETGFSLIQKGRGYLSKFVIAQPSS